MNLIAKIFVTCFYLGKSPIAPGTLGSMLAIILWYNLSYLGYLVIFTFFFIYLIFTYIFTNLYLKNSDKDDPSEVISDESPNIKLEDSNDDKENKNEKI